MARRECDRDDEQQHCVVGLLIISESANGNILEKGPPRIECSSVIIKKKMRGDEHQIVVLNKASDEVCCHQY